MIKTFPKDHKSFVIKVSLLAATLVAIYLFATLVLLPRIPALTYAFSNPDKVVWLIEADKQVKADGDLKIKSAIATLFMTDGK